MRPMLAFVLFLAALAVGGTLYFVLGRSAPASALESPEAPLDEAPTAARGTEALTAPAPAVRPDPAPDSLRTAISAAPKPEAPVVKGPGTTLTGRLVDTSGEPVAAADVRARAGEFDFPDFEGTGPGAPQGLRTKSDAAGRFELRGVQPGSLRLSVRAPGFVPLSKPGLGIPAALRHDLGDLALETSVILAGRVVDSRGAGVAGARLVRAPMDGVVTFDVSGDPSQGPPPLAVTAADGSFRIDQLASGPWRLRIASEEHPDKTESGTTKRPGERVLDLAFVLEDGFEIAGRVSGVPPASVADVTVVAGPPTTQGEFAIFGLETSGGGENRRRAKLATDGTFVVQGLRAGNYQLQARVQGSGAEAFWPRSASERVEAKSGDRGVLIAWQPSSVLAFQVLDLRTQAPVELVEVSAHMRGSMGFAGGGPGRAKRWPEGRVRIDELRPRDADDRATVEITAPGYKDARRTEIALARGQETDLGVIELEPVPTVDVHVVDARTRGALEGARVELREVAAGGAPEGRTLRMSRAITVEDDNGDVRIGGDDVARGKTDAEGNARLNSLPGKQGKLSVTMEGYAPFTTEPFDMPADGNVDRLVALDQGGAVEITLLSAEGAPVSGARLEHRAPEAGLEAFGPPFGRNRGAATDAEGKVTIANLAPGLHRFRPAKNAPGGEFGGGFAFSVDGREASSEGWGEVEVVRGATATLTLREPERTLVTGRVREGGAALAGATLSLQERGDGPEIEGLEGLPFGGGAPRAKTDGEGRYRFERVEAGSYELVVRHATRAMPARFALEVEGKGLEFDVELQVSILEGRVVDTENQPVAGAKVWASKRYSGPAGEVHSMRAIAVVAGGDEGGMVFDSSAGLEAVRARTDAEGRYVLRGVEHDVELEVNVDAKDAEPAKSEAVTVALGQTRSGIDVQVRPAGTLAVKVVVPAGRTAGPYMIHAEYLDPVPDGARVEPKTEFAQGGSVRIQGLRPGRWKLEAEALGGFGGEGNHRGEAREVLVVARQTVQTELPAP